MAESTRNVAQLETKLDAMLSQVAGLKDLVLSEMGRDARSQDLIIQSPVALYVIKDGVIRVVSSQMRQVTGYSEDDMVGTNLLSLVHQADRHEVASQMRGLLKTGGSYVREHRIVSKNATVRWVMDNACLASYEGGPAIIGNLVDITTHKEMEEASKGEEEKYRDLCESGTDMIQCVTTSGKIVYVNRCWRETLGYREDVINSLSLFDMVPSDYREHWADLLQRAAAGETVRDIESIVIDNQGSRVPVEGTVNCRFVDNRPVYVKGIFRDLRHRREQNAKAEAVLHEAQEINKRLQQSNGELEEFAYIASHDLQEPLRKISSFGEILQATLSDKLDADQFENLGYMIDGAKRMQSILDDLLSYSRISTGANPSRYVDANVVMDNLRNFELSELLSETGGQIVVPKALPSVYGDQPQIHQLFQNLIANGLKFHKQGIIPVVMVSSTPAVDNMVRFVVEDNGIGIDPEYHEQIFLMFKRLHSAKAYKGTGIGLAICKKIVQRHGGQIGLKSEAGKGAAFWFTLPLSDRATDPRNGK